MQTSIIKKILVCFTLSCAILGSTVFASNGPDHAMFSLSPQFCITKQTNQHCEVTLELKWQTSTPRIVCIHSNHPALSYWCALSADIDSYVIDISTNQDIQFTLIDKETQHTLATRTLKITPTVDTKTRRRNQWSLF